jgi:hypothetical protein
MKSDNFLIRYDGGEHKHSSLKIERQVEKLCALGPRPLLELLKEIDRGADVFERLAVYAQLPAEFLRANDGDKFLPPLFAIGGGRTNG